MRFILAYPAGRLCAQDESARNAGGTPGCGTADGAARRTRGTQTGSPPVPAGPGCRHPACGAPAEREASAALAMPVRTRNACTRVRTLRTGSLAPRPALCRAAAARAATCPMRSYLHGRTAVSPVRTERGIVGGSRSLELGCPVRGVPSGERAGGGCGVRRWPVGRAMGLPPGRRLSRLRAARAESGAAPGGRRRSGPAGIQGSGNASARLGPPGRCGRTC